MTQKPSVLFTMKLKLVYTGYLPILTLLRHLDILVLKLELKVSDMRIKLSVGKYI